MVRNTPASEGGDVGRSPAQGLARRGARRVALVLAVATFAGASPRIAPSQGPTTTTTAPTTTTAETTTTRRPPPPRRHHDEAVEEEEDDGGDYDGLLFAVEALVVIGAIVMGTKSSGVALGIWGGVGVAVLVFVLRADARLPARRRHPHHPRGDPRRRDHAGRRWHRLDGGDGGQRDPEPPQAGDPDRPADVVPVLPGRRHRQHRLPAAAGHLRRVVPAEDPPGATPVDDRRRLRHRAGVQPGVGGHGGHDHAHRRARRTTSA